MGVYTTIDPATGEQSATYPGISDAELNDLIGRSAAAYRSWRTTPLDRRRAVLTQAAEIHREQADELAKLLTLEMGKPIAQVQGEVALVASIYRYYADQAAECWPTSRWTSGGGQRRGPHRSRSARCSGSCRGTTPTTRWPASRRRTSRSATRSCSSTPRSARSRRSPIEQVFADAGLPDGAYINLVRHQRAGRRHRSPTRACRVSR